MEKYRAVIRPEGGPWWEIELYIGNEPMMMRTRGGWTNVRENLLSLRDDIFRQMNIEPRPIKIDYELEIPGVERGPFDDVVARLRANPEKAILVMAGYGLWNLHIADVLDLNFEYIREMRRKYTQL